MTLTVWFARTLRHSGRLFPVRAFHEGEELAGSINRLLVVGFHLAHLGWIAAALRIGVDVGDAAGALETVSVKRGGVMLIPGMTHFLKACGFNRLRRGAGGVRAPQERHGPGADPLRACPTRSPRSLAGR